MDKTARLAFRRGDCIAVGLVVFLMFLSALLFIPRGENEGAQVEIYQNGKLVDFWPLNEQRTITLTGEYTNVIATENGKAAIVESDCPGEDCVHSGWISSAGRAIVCLPNRTEIRITGESQVDFVVR